MNAALLLTGVVVLVTHGLEAITGFGCTVLAMPFAAMLLGLDKAKFILATLGWVLAVYFAVTKFRQIVWKQYLVIVFFMALGMPLGMWAFARLDRVLLTRALGVFIIASAGLQLWKLLSKPKVGKSLPAPLYWFLLFVGGIVHGAFATGGPLVVLYASKALPDKGNFRATLVLLWSTLNAALIVQFALAGAFTGQAWGEFGLMAPFLIAGMVGGEIIHHRVDSDRFSKIVFAMLFVTGFVMALA
jgi:hypothetical protein